MVRSHTIVMALLLSALPAACRSGLDGPCERDEACTEGLVCHGTRCRTPEAVEEAREECSRVEAALEGLQRLADACIAVHDADAIVDRDTARLTALAKQQGLHPGGDVKDFDVEMDTETFLEMLTHRDAADEARYSVLPIGVPLYDENPVFRRAAREALRAILPEGALGPSVPTDIEFCDVEFLSALRRFL